jgi:hypothetical protein
MLKLLKGSLYRHCATEHRRSVERQSLYTVTHLGTECNMHSSARTLQSSWLVSVEFVMVCEFVCAAVAVPPHTLYTCGNF